MGQVLLLFSFAADLWWPKGFSEILSCIHFATFRTDDAVDKAGRYFYSEGIGEVVRLLCSVRMDDVV